LSWTVLAEPTVTGSTWYVDFDLSGSSTLWYIRSNAHDQARGEWYVAAIDLDDSEPWRAWISDPDLPNTTFLRKSEAPEDFLVNPEQVTTTPENTQADADDWTILPDPN